MKMGQTQCSETLAYKIQMPGSYPLESTQHSEQGESLKSRISKLQSGHYRNAPTDPLSIAGGSLGILGAHFGKHYLRGILWNQNFTKYSRHDLQNMAV